MFCIIPYLKDFKIISNTIPLICDNTSALNMSKNFMQHKMAKHIHVRHHFLRDSVEKGAICMIFFKIKDQVADIFTKALHKEQFVKNSLRLGLKKMS